MPIVRIDLIEGKSEEYRVRVGEIVYQTLVDVLNVPKGDRFQVITEHRKFALCRTNEGKGYEWHDPLPTGLPVTRNLGPVSHKCTKDGAY